MKKNAKNYAIWTALNSDMSFFSSRPSYYGGSSRTAEQKAAMEKFTKKHNLEPSFWGVPITLDFLNTIGIDWNACSTPESDTASRFEGTFCDSGVIDIVCGVLVLKDGTRIDYYAECKLNMDQFEAMQKFFNQAEEM